MDAFIADVAEKAGINPDVARVAIGEILLFLEKEAPASHFTSLIENMPGASQLVTEAQADKTEPTGGFGSLLSMVGGGGGIMGLAGKLSALGLGMGEMESVGKAVFDHVRATAGEDVVGQIVAHIPGLSRFV